MTHPIRLLALDIDGTLLDSAFRVPQPNLDALRRAHQAGVEVVLTTGRRHIFAMPIAEALAFDLWLISSNGAITRSTHGETFHRDLLPAALARDLLRHMEPFRKHAVVTYDTEARGALLLEDADTLHHSIARWLEKNEPYLQRVPSLPDALTADPVQAMFCGEIAPMRAAEAHLASFARLAQLTALKTEYEHRNLCMLDLLNHDCSKGHALKRWAAYRGIDRRHVMAVGDNYNDVEMLDFAGFPFIMDNACAELKQNGWRLTSSNDQSGVAAAIASLGI